MKTNDRVLTDMPVKVLEQKVRAEVHPLVDAAVAAADGVLRELPRVRTLEELSTLLQDTSRPWKVGFHSKVALAALTLGLAGAIEVGRQDIEAAISRGCVQEVTAPWEEFLRGLGNELN